VDPGVSQFDGFFEESHTDAIDSGSFEGSRHCGSTVSIAIGFEDAPDAGSVGKSTDGPQVMPQVVEVDFSPCGSNGVSGGGSTGSLDSGQGGEGRNCHIAPFCTYRTLGVRSRFLPMTGERFASEGLCFQSYQARDTRHLNRPWEHIEAHLMMYEGLRTRRAMAPDLFDATMHIVQVVLHKLGRGSRAVTGRLVKMPRKGSVIVIEFSDGLHEYVTTPVRRMLRIAGHDVFFIETANSRYRLEICNSEQDLEGASSG
jgi:hypothetical protein